MAGEKLVQKALQAAMEARAAKHVADPAERAANLAKFDLKDLNEVLSDGGLATNHDSE